MAKYAAFLRGMNLGGRRITNVELCACFEGLGFGGVAAFLASGNVVFDATATATSLGKKIEAGLKKALRYEVPTFVRSAAQVRAIAARDPFANRKNATSRGKLQVALLGKKPAAAATRAVKRLATDDDWLAIDGRELYWLPVGNLSDSALDFAAIGEQLGPMTIRTKRTIDRLAAKFFAA